MNVSLFNKETISFDKIQTLTHSSVHESNPRESQSNKTKMHDMTKLLISNFNFQYRYFTYEMLIQLFFRNNFSYIYF